MFGVFYVPNFRLQTVLRWRQELHTEAVAIVDEVSSKSLLLEVNEAARKSGVVVGMPSSQALARCPNLRLFPPVLSGEHSVGELLVETAFRFTPNVEATGPGCCTLDLRKVRNASYSEIARSACNSLLNFQITAQIGFAPNPDLAFLAAKQTGDFLEVYHPETFLSQLTVAELGPPPHLLAILKDWGIHTLGDLMKIPRGDLSDRLGLEANQLWERASGKTTRLLRLERTVETFAEAFDFEYAVETVEPLYFLLRRFLEQMSLRLENAGKVAGQMKLQLPLEDGSLHEREFTIPSPTRNPDKLFAVLTTYLESLQLSHPLKGVRLGMQPVRVKVQQYRLFETALRDPDRFGETLARIVALVGSENVGVAKVTDTHRPDGFEIQTPDFQNALELESVSSQAIGLPLRRFRPHFPASVQLQKHHPAQLVSEKISGKIVDSLGPYRSSGEWWEKNPWQIEEWDVEVAGRGLFRLSRQENQWWIEGCYDTAIC